MTSMHERLTMETQAWKPEPVDQLVGTITDLSERASDYGPYPIVTISNTDGNYEFHAFHTVAKQELQRRNPQIGDQIGVIYHGKPDGKDYEHYRIIIERRPTAPNPLLAIAEEPF